MIMRGRTTNMIHIAIVEDDPSCSELLHRYIQRFFADRQEAFSVSFFSDGEDISEKYKPVFDVVFMDIEMKRLNGMEAARQIRKIDKHTVIIFVTQMAQYAVKGYEVSALDFIIKPVDYHSFAFKMTRALEYLDVNQEVKLVLQDGSNWIVLHSSQIYYIEVMNHSLIYHTKNGTITTRGSLRELEQKLKTAGFKRCSKSFLLNMAYISAIQGNSIHIGGDSIPLSRSMRKELLYSLADYYGGKV